MSIKTSAKQRGSEKRKFDSLEEGTGHTRGGSERVDHSLVFIKEVVARIQHEVINIAARLPPFFPFAYTNLVVVSFLGGSIDTDCRDGEECCEEVFRE